MNSLYGTPITGMRGAEFGLDMTANNIANLNTSGYEAVEPILANLPAQAEIGDPNNGIAVPATTHVGMGTQPAATVRNGAQTPLVPTGNPLDLAIDGPGFLTVRQSNGQLAYAKQVALHVAPDGQIATAQGLTLAPPIRVGPGVMSVSADAQGRLVGQTRAGATVAVGKLAVVSFAAPENLREQSGLYTETLGSGRPQARQPGTAAAGETQVMSGYKLGSNVDLATEMTNMIEEQHMYEASSKALQTLDALVGNIVTLQTR